MKFNNSYIKNYDQKGWIVLKSFLNKEEVRLAKNKINEFLKKNIDKFSGRSINFAKKKQKISEINSFHELHHCKWIKNFSKKKKVINIVKQLLSSKELELRASEYFAKPKKIGLMAPPHQDNYYWNIKNNRGLTIWISLSRSNKLNGSVYYFNGSHKKGLFEHKPSNAKGSSQMIKNLSELKKFKKIFPNLETGDALLHHCLVVHGSYRNKSNFSRKGLTFQFKDKNSKYDLKAIKKYEKLLDKQIKKRENY